MDESIISGKPILVHFTCHGCLSDSKMEDELLYHPEVKNQLNKDFIFVQLFINDKIDLKEKITTKKSFEIKKFGQLWSLFQTEKTNSMTQPYFAVFDSQLNLISEPIDIYPRKRIKLFLNWLNEYR